MAASAAAPEIAAPTVAAAAVAVGSSASSHRNRLGTSRFGPRGSSAAHWMGHGASHGPQLLLEFAEIRTAVVVWEVADDEASSLVSLPPLAVIPLAPRVLLASPAGVCCLPLLASVSQKMVAEGAWNQQ